MKFFLVKLVALVLILAIVLPGCGDKETIVQYSRADDDRDKKYDEEYKDWDDDIDRSGIPPDPGGSLPPVVFNNLNPTATFEVSEYNEYIIRTNVTGLIDPVTGDPIELVANENVFLEEDGTVKGLRVTKVGVDNILRADVVFTIDVSGSMAQEANAVATGIVALAQVLEASGLDVRFGCVGYSGYVYGGINFTDAAGLEAFLSDRPGHESGTTRPTGFAGADSAALHEEAINWAIGVGGENGVVGVLFADSFYTWRGGAQRHFINFTDEPTQPGDIYQWGTENMCEVIGGRATVHTVFSEDTMAYMWSELNAERPWWMSECTGGTVVYIDNLASNLDLSSLPIVGSLSSSYLIEFITTDPYGTHTIRIVIKVDGADGMVIYIEKKYDEG